MLPVGGESDLQNSGQSSWREGQKSGKPKKKVVKLRLRSPPGTVHSDAQFNHLLFTNSLLLCHMHIPYSVLSSFLHATSSRVYTQWHMAQSPKPSLWPLVSGIYVKTTLERCGPFSLVVLSQRRSQVTPLSGHSDQNASETFSNKLQLNKVQSSLRQTSAKTTQVRSKAKTS